MTPPPHCLSAESTEGRGKKVVCEYSLEETAGRTVKKPSPYHSHPTEDLAGGEVLLLCIYLYVTLIDSLVEKRQRRGSISYLLAHPVNAHSSWGCAGQNPGTYTSIWFFHMGDPGEILNVTPLCFHYSRRLEAAPPSCPLPVTQHGLRCHTSQGPRNPSASG